MEFEEVTPFVSEFFYGKGVADGSRFWILSRSDSNMLEVEKTKAETYIENYELKNYLPTVSSYFEGAIGFVWERDHEPQLEGEISNDEFKFKTLELDMTPFLLKIEKEGFEPKYFLGNFLGGCYRQGTIRKIEMSSVKTAKSL
ncbi:MAG: hypothetical protein KDB79_07040 [Acidobacteria bacterium]|nr:hypothetical protein [Acidobacteriota bacterium]